VPSLLPKDSDLFCPVCRRQLIATCEGYYETLDEHVCDPNSDPTKRTGYTCINNICVAHTLGAVWIYNGEGPYGIPYDKYDIVKKASVNSIDHPFGSYWRKIKAEERVRTRLLSFSLPGPNRRKHGLLIEWEFKATEDGERIWWKTKGTFNIIINDTYYHPGINSFVSTMRSYIKPYRWVNRAKELKDHKKRIDAWDKRWWSVLSFKIAKTIYKIDYKISQEI
jgi:hypothetical protein